MKIGFLQQPGTIGGPGSFQLCLERELKRQGHEVVFLSNISDQLADLLLIMGAPLKLLPQIIRLKRKGIPIVHRLSGFYWRHRIESMTPREKLNERLRNLTMRFVRNNLADYVVYQSRFVKRWWHKECGPSPCPETIIFNGVDINEFSPPHVNRSEEKPLLLVVEGEIRFTTPVMKMLTIVPKLLASRGIINRTEVYGRLVFKTRAILENVPELHLMGPVARQEIPHVFRQRGIYLSVKVNHSCPNVVLEAIASGMPVVGFDTGALSELVSPEAGCVISYGANPWRLECPDVNELVQAIMRVAQRLDDYCRGARRLAEQRFGLESMTRAYMKVFYDVTSKRFK